jgi:hypothetical protein
MEVEAVMAGELVKGEDKECKFNLHNTTRLEFFFRTAWTANTTAIVLAPEIMRSLQSRCQGMARGGPGCVRSWTHAPHMT